MLLPATKVPAPKRQLPQVLVICGPTATGKTRMALRLAKELNGELISADSRQVYLGNDIETGKDLHLNTSNIPIWLYDVVTPDEEFSVSTWRNLAKDAIEDILSRGKLPIVVGGSGLYLKSLTQSLPDIDTPRNQKLRIELENKTATELFDYLKHINPAKAESLNDSDRNNPRRLIRAIEIILNKSTSPKVREGLGVSYLQIGLTAPKEFLEQKIRTRVQERGLDKSFEAKEIAIMKKQLVWFKKQPDIFWLDISLLDSDAIIAICQEKLRFPTAP